MLLIITPFLCVVWHYRYLSVLCHWNPLCLEQISFYPFIFRIIIIFPCYLHYFVHVSNTDIFILCLISNILYIYRHIVHIFWHSLHIFLSRYIVMFRFSSIYFRYQPLVHFLYLIRISLCGLCLDSLTSNTDVALLFRFYDIHNKYRPVV